MTNRLIEATRAEVRRVDAEMMSALKEAISNGSFVVRTDALADRMVDDALGVEVLGEGAV